ncbi:formate-dependent phosphoribosylglycinamide formyltransferase [Candidatus Tachikawaea gelatinosa]|uniref:Formate-dependent phosphoribosylglycinamide formyltransferase n=1 Tax=Candidatus Tachikawaea gelatinosa TaxID=1410383 RepID=A0A090AM56_9ENTR|nr:formate-dependent phosphoribosylglycinamide formyltransferase [Candidatus Tachikawaea gelatinosa]BAP58739.1 phosphoribosylglycinamide formyltransferase 2 [Candidatus Tachikawaea gelatinosa]
MITIGTPLCSSATRVMLLGSGELGKEIAIECQRLGIETIAVDRYQNAPAMQVAHKQYVINMLNEKELCMLINQEKPNFIVPEIEAISTTTLLKLEKKGYKIVPSAYAIDLTMNREKIRSFVRNQLKIPAAKYYIANNKIKFIEMIKKIGFPCIVKPLMSSSGKGQSVLHNFDKINEVWDKTQKENRAHIASSVIIEEFINFDFEITLLTVSAVDGIHFCSPIGHRQKNGDYRESWQPQEINDAIKKSAYKIAKKIVLSLKGYGIFGVELFIKNNEVIFNEISPRPHDTGLVTLISQDMSQFSLHVRSFLGIPIGSIRNHNFYCASSVILSTINSNNIKFNFLKEVLKKDIEIKLFGKQHGFIGRRLGIVLSKSNISIKHAIKQAKIFAKKIVIT